MTWDIPQMVTAVTGILDKLIPDKDARERAANAIVMEQLRQQEAQMAAQSKINEVEAGSPNPFVNSWRPAVGWLCALGFGWQVFGQPLLSFCYAMIFRQPAPVVPIPEDMVMPMLYALLGVGALRTFEKVKGVATK
jgi:hypothetical protein